MFAQYFFIIVKNAVCTCIIFVIFLLEKYLKHLEVTWSGNQSWLLISGISAVALIAFVQRHSISFVLPVWYEMYLQGGSVEMSKTLCSFFSFLWNISQRAKSISFFFEPIKRLHTNSSKELKSSSKRIRLVSSTIKAF